MTQETEGMKLWREACHIYGGASIQGTCGEARAAYIIDKALTERDTTIAEQAKQIEALRVALVKIEEGDYPRPIGKPWRMDASSSKHDRCIHDAWMYETCEGCLGAFTSQALASMEPKP